MRNVNQSLNDSYMPIVRDRPIFEILESDY